MDIGPGIACCVSTSPASRRVVIKPRLILKRSSERLPLKSLVERARQPGSKRQKSRIRQTVAVKVGSFWTRSIWNKTSLCKCNLANQACRKQMSAILTSESITKFGLFPDISRMRTRTGEIGDEKTLQTWKLIRRKHLCQSLVAVATCVVVDPFSAPSLPHLYSKFYRRLELIVVLRQSPRVPQFLMLCFMLSYHGY